MMRTRKKRELDLDKKRINSIRVNNYRLRIKLSTPQTPPNVPVSDPGSSAYKHKSSETRAFKRLERTLPLTPAKKAKLIEKLVTNSTPRSRVMLQNSNSFQAAINSKTTRKRLSTQFAVVESIKNKFVDSKTTASSIAAAKLLTKARKVSSAATMLKVSRKMFLKSLCGKSERKERKDRMSVHEVSRIHDFYLEEASREMPNKRDVILLKDKNGKKFPTAKQMMDMTQSEAYEQFKYNNPDIKVGQRKFDMLRPEQVRRANVAYRVVCCCTYCENIRLKLQTLNKITQKPLKSSNELINSTLCAKTAHYHAKLCIKRQCMSCGTKLLEEMFREELEQHGNRHITYASWAKKSVLLDETRHVSRVMLVHEETTFSEFFSVLQKALEPHAAHIFRASWQYYQFRQNVENIQEGEIVMCMDFAENYTCRYGREIQSAHWNQKQITIHPMMLYYKKDGTLQKEGYTIITDDLKHDAHAVGTFERAAIEHLREEGVTVNKVHQWTDGCAAQYKCKNSFASISHAESSLDISLTRNYFETSHGKGPCDGLGGIVKRKVTTAVVQDGSLHVSCARDLTIFCDKNLKTVGGTSRVNKYAASKRTFKLIDLIDRSAQTSCKTLNGTRQLHSVRSTGVNHQIETRLLSCYCQGCRNNEECENAVYIDSWDKHVLKACDASRNNVALPDAHNTEEEVQMPEEENDSDFGANDFVAVKFKSKSRDVCYFAKVIEIDGSDIHVEFLEKRGRMYMYNDPADESWEKRSDVVCRLNVPNVIFTGSRSKCEFNLPDSQKDILKGLRLL